eukprot:CAMPEP_0170505716 /NCGR_PEP_ID=MMETSP0208-20121228/51989_1 /TAXON_ID=197538 /ORGANISM="Strombidium inclinatum, Strain S3" /LENGTH=46 /DNA_ID= /DNA_START= /DNA_END= /DNA_ORIENTATION=
MNDSSFESLKSDPKKGSEDDEPMIMIEDQDIDVMASKKIPTIDDLI